jgi:hypothetical protein
MQLRTDPFTVTASNVFSIYFLLYLCFLKGVYASGSPYWLYQCLWFYWSFIAVPTAFWREWGRNECVIFCLLYLKNILCCPILLLMGVSKLFLAIICWGLQLLDGFPTCFPARFLWNDRRRTGDINIGPSPRSSKCSEATVLCNIHAQKRSLIDYPLLIRD